ncbi:MAG: hypothetical protein IKU66_01830 [Clostridia bacterium]|nr:hypothetical protein [Clostridia bacterium]
MKNKLTRKKLSLILATIILLSAFTIPSSAFSLKVCSNPNIILSKWHLCILKDYKEPDCENDGYVNYKCLFCKYKKTVVKEAHGHSLSESETINPTCETDGYTIHNCENCGYVDSKAISATGHSIVETEKVDATCLEDGYIKYACENCGYSETAIQHKTGHTIVFIDGDNATCTEDGWGYFECENCNYNYHRDFPATGHNVVVTKSAIEPSCSEDGRTEEQRCNICSILIKRSKKIPALGHMNQEVEITKATTQEDGIIKGKCHVCGEYNQEIIKKPKYASTEEKAYTYTGKEIEPIITVYDEDDNIIDESEYYVEYSDNINDGWALADIYFTGEKYEGHMDTVFLIDTPPEFKYFNIYNTSPNGFTVKYDISITVKKMELQFSLFSDFEKAETVTRNVSTGYMNTKTLKYSIAGLKASTTYYVRMRLQYENGTYSNWVTKSIKILN